jgi:hypothetical protein
MPCTLQPSCGKIHRQNVCNASEDVHGNQLCFSSGRTCLWESALHTHCADRDITFKMAAREPDPFRVKECGVRASNTRLAREHMCTSARAHARILQRSNASVWVIHRVLNCRVKLGVSACPAVTVANAVLVCLKKACWCWMVVSPLAPAPSFHT